MNPNFSQRENEQPCPQPRQRFYAYTDNGDWMEMRPSPGGNLFAGDGVSFLALDAEDEVGFYLHAEEGEGLLLGRVTIVDGVPVLHAAADLVARYRDA